MGWATTGSPSTCPMSSGVTRHRSRIGGPAEAQFAEGRRALPGPPDAYSWSGGDRVGGLDLLVAPGDVADPSPIEPAARPAPHIAALVRRPTAAWAGSPPKKRIELRRDPREREAESSTHRDHAESHAGHDRQACRLVVLRSTAPPPPRRWRGKDREYSSAPARPPAHRTNGLSADLGGSVSRRPRAPSWMIPPSAAPASEPTGCAQTEA